MTTTDLQAQDAAPRQSILAEFAASKGLNGNDMYEALRDTIFPRVRGEVVGATKEQVNALCIVAQQHNLNPFTREIWAFPAKGKGVVPIVSIDGWLKLMNDHPQFDGVETAYTYSDQGALLSCIATIHRKDRSHPTRIEEDLSENTRPTDPWRNQPKRMLRHRAIIQAARIAFSFSGFYDPDEGERIVEAQVVSSSSGEPDMPTGSVAAEINKELESESQAKEPEPAQEGEDPAWTAKPDADPDGTLYGDADAQEDPA